MWQLRECLGLFSICLGLFSIHSLIEKRKERFLIALLVMTTTIIQYCTACDVV